MVKKFNEYNEGFESNLNSLKKSMKKRKSSKVDKVIKDISSILDNYKHPLGGHTSWSDDDIDQIIDALKKYKHNI